MFVSFWFGNSGEVENITRVEHRFSERLLLILVHPIQIDGHEQGTNLVIGDATARHSGNEELDLFARKIRTISFSSDDVLRSHLLSINTTAWTVTASLCPTASGPSQVLALTLTHTGSTPRTPAR